MNNDKVMFFIDNLFFIQLFYTTKKKVNPSRMRLVALVRSTNFLLILPMAFNIFSLKMLEEIYSNI